jgi:ATPase complex subunit ATP10
MRFTCTSILTLRSCVHYQSPIRLLLLQLSSSQRSRYATNAPSAQPAAAAAASADQKPAAPPKPQQLPPVDHFPKSEKELRQSKPPQLIRPIGLQNPPQPGENSGVDPRSLQQRRDDFVNYDKHLEKRKRLSVTYYSMGKGKTRVPFADGGG